MNASRHQDVGGGGSGKRWHYWSVVDMVDPVLGTDTIVVVQNNCTQLVDLNDDLAHFKQKARGVTTPLAPPRRRVTSRHRAAATQNNVWSTHR